MSTKVYLITGANRGIGLAMVKELAASQPEATIYAGTRQPELPASQALQAFAKENAKVKVVKLDVRDIETIKAAVEAIKKDAGQLDVVIANAGVNVVDKPILELPADHWRQTWETNTLGTVQTFLGTSDLLLKSKEPHFVVLSSLLARLTNYIDLKCAPYASSKVASGMFVRSLDAEIPALTTYAISPGWVDTDMGQIGSERIGMKPPLSDAQSAKLILAVVNTATREKYGGKLVDAAAQGGPVVEAY